MKLNFKILSSYIEDFPIYFYESTDSTNTRAELILKERKSENFAVVAKEQTDGKGRCGKSFFSPKDTGVYFSVVIHLDGNYSDIVGLTPMAAVAVVNSIEKYTDLKPTIKWVNDIYSGDKKICGILVKSTGNAYIIGIGINVTTVNFPEDLIRTAGSIGHDIDFNMLVADIIKNILSMSAELSEKKFMDEYRKKSNVIGKQINYYINSEQYDGLVIDIDDSGGLTVEKNGIKKVLTSGEITVRTK